MSNTERVTLERENGTVIITLCNPARRNAFTREMRREMTAKINELQMDPSVRAIILTGEGKHFCAGADLAKLDGESEQGVHQLRESIRETFTMVRAITDGTKPIISAVEGSAVGAGLSIALASDFMIAAKDAKLACTFVKLGLAPDAAIMHTLPNRVGQAKARRMMMLAEPLTGEEADNIGMLDELADPGEALAVAKQLAARFEDLAPLAIGAVKVGLNAGVTSIDDIIALELHTQPPLVLSEDSKEGMRAFMEKRRPIFKGR